MDKTTTTALHASLVDFVNEHESVLGSEEESVLNSAIGVLSFLINDIDRGDRF